MRIWIAAGLLGLGVPSVAEAKHQHPVMLSTLTDFDLADGKPQPLLISDERDAAARFLAPDIGNPPGVARKPAKLRIRGRKIKLRIPLG